MRSVHVPSSGNQASFDELVGVTSHDFSVFTGTWFTLICVDNKITRTLVSLPVGLVHKAPLETTGEAGTTTTAKTRVLYCLNNPRVALEYYVLGFVPVSPRLSWAK